MTARVKRSEIVNHALRSIQNYEQLKRLKTTEIKTSKTERFVLKAKFDGQRFCV